MIMQRKIHTAINFFIYLSLTLLLTTACNNNSDKGLKVAASSVPHAEMLEQIKDDLEHEGINLIIVVSDDYNIPNRALANHEVDANFFQHAPFLEEQIKHFSYPLESIATIEIEPMGIYSKKIKSLKDLKDNATVAIPNDPTNEGRALLLLQDAGIITLDNPKSLSSTILNIRQNPKHLRFIEVDAAMLPRTLEDVDIAAINTNYALEAKLSALTDALIIEGKNSPYANILVVRKGEETRPDIQLLVKAMTSDKMKEFILKKYKGAVTPAF